MKDYILYTINLAHFDANTVINTTTTDTLSEEMKTYYSDYLIDLAEPELVHDQFAQKQPIPKGNGKTVQFRKYDSLGGDAASRTLTEGQTPAGQKLSMGIVEATVGQYGGYVEISDMLILSAIDNNLVQATRLLASQAAKVLDSITRDAMALGGIRRFAGGVTDKGQLSNANKEHYLTVNDIRLAVRTLKKANAPKIDGSYMGIIHTDVAYDLMSDPNWKAPHEYKDTENVYEGEIGKIYGVRFVETSEGKVHVKGGASNSDVYETFIFGADAYGTTEITGGGLEHIVKQLGSAGTADPLNQRATVGWKATKVSKVLVDDYLVRIMSAATPEQ
jgi:N4-gp56 family major capsid protein